MERLDAAPAIIERKEFLAIAIGVDARDPEIMKKATTVPAAFLFGAILGFLIAHATFHWLASALGAPLVAASPTDPLAVRSRFAIGCGVLFAAAAILSNSARRLSLYLAVGVAASIGAAVLYRVSYASTFSLLPSGLPHPGVSLKDLPALRFPLFGTIAIAGLAFVLRILESGPRDHFTTNDRNA